MLVEVDNRRTASVNRGLSPEIEAGDSNTSVGPWTLDAFARARLLSCVRQSESLHLGASLTAARDSNWNELEWSSAQHARLQTTKETRSSGLQIAVELSRWLGQVALTLGGASLVGQVEAVGSKQVRAWVKQQYLGALPAVENEVGLGLESLRKTVSDLQGMSIQRSPALREKAERVATAYQSKPQPDANAWAEELAAAFVQNCKN